MDFDSTSWLSGILPDRLFRADRGGVQYEPVKLVLDEDQQFPQRPGSIEDPQSDDVYYRPRPLPVILAMLPLMLLVYYFSTVLAVGRTVHLDYASYSGTPSSNGVTKWLGMRYAAPPTENLRFAAPEDPLRVSGVHPAIQVSLSSS